MKTPIFYVPGHLEAVIALAVLAAVVIIINIAIFAKLKANKNKANVTPTQNKDTKSSIKEDVSKKEDLSAEEKPVKYVTIAKEDEPQKEEPIINKEVQKKEEEITNKKPTITKEVSLKESLIIASNNAGGVITKKMVADYLEKTYGKDVEVNRRANATKPAKGKTEGLPLADTHYTLSNGERKCFVYVYEVNGSSLVLIKAPKDYATKLKDKHNLVSLSAFPKSKDTWYSLPIDDSWNKKDLFKMLDDVKTLNDGGIINTIEEDDDEDEETEVVYDESKGTFIKIRYNKSFSAKLIQAKDETKDYYTELKNYILSFKFPKKQINDSISWKHESFRLGRDILVKMIIKGKTLCLCLPLNAKDYLDSKYHVEDKSDKKAYLITPTMYRIKNPRRAFYARDLIDEVMAKFGGEKVDVEYVDYKNQYPYEEIKPLIDRKLVKVIEVADDNLEDSDIKVLKEVSINQVDKLMSDEETEKLTERGQRKVDKTRKTMINVDTLSEYFKNGETVTIEELKKRVPSFDKKATYYKVCARGTLKKRLIVDADDVSVGAKKMILLTGGKVILSSNR